MIPDIKVKEFFENLFDMGWMSEQEKQTIYDAAELYAKGRVNKALEESSSDVEKRLKELIKIIDYPDSGTRAYEVVMTAYKLGKAAKQSSANSGNKICWDCHGKIDDNGICFCNRDESAIVEREEKNYEPEDKLYEFAKYMNQWYEEGEQFNGAVLKNIVNDYLASKGNPQSSTSLASHSCTVDNSIQQKWYRADVVEGWIRETVAETARGCLEFFEKDSVIKDKDGNPLPNAWICLTENPTPLTERIYPRLSKHGIKFNSDKNVPVSDTTEDSQ